ncbi:MAG TPA: hypothetical protein VFS08_13740, partial [Gemmatimonadaceae bacterium]|nr:hypothetical protein [Gemmatimonadaceae bacterium]
LAENRAAAVSLSATLERLTRRLETSRQYETQLRAALESSTTEAGELARALEDLDLLLLTVICEAEALGKVGRPAEAEHRLGEALGFFSTAGNGVRRAECLLVLGDIHRAQAGAEHAETARRCYEVAARLGAELGAARVSARAAASLAALQGDAAAPER